MNLNRASDRNPAEVLRGWDGICREFGCSEEQILELYHNREGLPDLHGEFTIISETEFAEEAIFSSGAPLN
jgi:hypothetical protein